MFGYVRPLKPELKCKDFDLYRATYCGLCRCLRQRYGVFAPLTLNFDFTFLSLLLWDDEPTFSPCTGRCHGNPLRKKPMCPNSPALEHAADVSMILTWWKLKDSIQDDGLLKKVEAFIASCALRPSYRKAVSRCPEFDATARQCLSELKQLEKEQSTSLDRTADTFARLLQATLPENTQQGRVLSQLLYHLGRWIYLADARDDLKDDLEQGRYNPVSARFGPQGDDELLSLTMTRSLEQMGTALSLGAFGCRTPLLENIVYLGLPMVQKAIFNGSWDQIKKQKIWRNSQ